MSDEHGKLFVLPYSSEKAKRLDMVDGPDAPVERKAGHRDCRHKQVELDVVGRVIRCKECEQVIDPIDWIETLSREWERYVYRWRSARAKCEGIEKAVEELERVEKNARARLRRLNGKLAEKGEPPEEIDLFRRFTA